MRCHHPTFGFSRADLCHAARTGLCVLMWQLDNCCVLLADGSVELLLGSSPMSRFVEVTIQRRLPGIVVKGDKAIGALLHPDATEREERDGEVASLVESAVAANDIARLGGVFELRDVDFGVPASQLKN